MRRAVAREIMSSPVITVSPDTPFQEVVATMLQHGISGLPVVDDNGRLLGSSRRPTSSSRRRRRSLSRR